MTIGLQLSDRLPVLNRSTLVRLALVTAVLTPVILAYAVLCRWSFPVPYFDDYHAILSFAIQYQRLPSWTSKLLLITDYQHNEYKLIFEHLIVASELEITGHPNFEFLTMIGNLFLIQIGWLLWRICRAEVKQLNRALIEFLPISWLFFSLTYWEAMNWAMSGLQNLPVIFFAMLSIKLLVSAFVSTKISYAHFCGSCLSALFSVLSSANGFLLAPIGLFVLIRRRAYLASLGWCALYLIPVAAYAHKYTPVHHPSEVPCSVRMLSFFIFIGAGGPVTFNWQAAFLGVAVASVFGLSIHYRFERIHPTLFYFTLWVFMCGGLIAWVRGQIAPRYMIYSVLLFIFAYEVLLTCVLKRLSARSFRRFFGLTLAFAVTVCIHADLNAYRQLGRRKEFVLSGFNQYLKNPEKNSPLTDPLIIHNNPDEANFERNVLNSAIQERVYVFPAYENQQPGRR